MTEHLRTLRRERVEAERAALAASLPSVRAYFADEARRLSALIRKAEAREVTADLRTRWAGVCL